MITKTRVTSGPLAVGADVPHHLDGLDHDETAGEELVDLGQERADALLGVDDDDGDRQVLAQGQDAVRVDPARLAVALDAAEDARAGETGAVRAVDDLRVDG